MAKKATGANERRQWAGGGLIVAVAIALGMAVPMVVWAQQDPGDGAAGTLERRTPSRQLVADFLFACEAEAKLDWPTAWQRFADVFFGAVEVLADEDATADHYTAQIVARAAIGKWSAVADDLGKAAEPERLLDAADELDDRFPVLTATIRRFAGRSADARGDFATAEMQNQYLGFLRHWTVIGPFRNEHGSGFDTVYPPETDTPPALDAEVPGSARPVKWRPLPVNVRGGFVVLDDLMSPGARACAYAVALVEVHRVPKTVALRFGTGCAYKLFVNGRLVAQRDAERSFQLDQEVVGLKLPVGINRIMFKFCTEDRGFHFAARITEPTGDRVRRGLGTISTSDELLFRQSWDESLTMTGQAAERAACSFGPTDFVVGNRADASALRGMTPAAVEFFRAIFHKMYAFDDPKARKAAEHLERALRIEPDNALFHYAYSSVAGEVARVAEEREENRVRMHLEKAVELRPDYADAWLRLANYYLAIANDERAGRCAKQAAALMPEASRVTAVQVEILRRQRFDLDVDARVDALWKRFAQAPETVDAFEVELLATTAMREGRRAEAEALFAARLRLDQTSLLPRFHAIQFAKTRGDHERAQHLIAQWIRLHPSSHIARTQLSDVYRSMGDYEAAAKVADEALRINPHREDWWIRLGEDHFFAGDRDTGDWAWERALEINPINARLKEYFAFVAAGQATVYEDRFLENVEPFIAEGFTAPFRRDRTHDVVYRQEILRVEMDGKSRQFSHEVIRITNPEGARRFQRHFPQRYMGTAKIYFARIHRTTGEIEDARIFDFGAIDFGTNLQVGDMLEYRVRTDTPASDVFGDYFGRTIFFGDLTAIRQWRFVLVWPAARPVGLHPPHIVAQAEQESDEAEAVNIYRWSRQHIAPVEPEPMMPPPQELLPMLQISTYRTWDEFAIWYWNLIRKQVQVTEEIREKVAELIADVDDGDTAEKIRVIYEFVTAGVRYNDAWEFGIHGYQPYTAQAILRRQFGDCKDKAILMMAMFECIGVKSYPVIIRAAPYRGQEDITLPMIGHFNHAIALVEWPDGTERFLDGTADYHPVDTVPATDMGAQVLVVMPTGGRIVQVPWPKPEENAVNATVRIELQRDGSGIIRDQRYYTGPRAAQHRYNFQNPERRKELVEESWGNVFPGIEVTEMTYSDLADLTVMVSRDVTLQAPNVAVPRGDEFAVRPMMFRYNWLQGPFGHLTTRRYDMMMGVPMGDFIEVEFVPPPGYKLAEVPPAIERDLPFAHFHFHAEEMPDGVVKVRYRFGVRANRIRAEEYPAWRALIEEIDRVENSVLRFVPAR